MYSAGIDQLDQSHCLSYAIGQLQRRVKFYSTFFLLNTLERSFEELVPSAVPLAPQAITRTTRATSIVGRYLNKGRNGSPSIWHQLVWTDFHILIKSFEEEQTADR